MASCLPVNHAAAMNCMEEYRLEFERVLARIVKHARIAFRDVLCSHKRADCIAEVTALSWKWWIRLRLRGKNPLAFVSVLAAFAARAVRSGRRVCGQEKSRDAMSRTAQQRHGFCVGKLPDYETLSDNPLSDALHDNTQSPVPDQVAFRIDFPAWLRTHCHRNRRIIQAMMRSERTRDLSRKFGIGDARISQLRSEFHRDWHTFHGESA